MSEILLSSELLPYWVAAGVLVGLGAVEALGMLVGMSVAGFDHAVATDAPHLPLADLHGHPGHDFAGSALGWLNLGRVPLLILLMILLAGFAASGVVEVLALRHAGIAAPWIVTAPLAAMVSVLLTRQATRLVGRLLPRDETYAASPEDWIGLTAEITLGPARSGVVAVARLKDRFGNWHFPHVEPLFPDTEIAQGTTVLAVERRGEVLLVVPAEGRLSATPATPSK